MGRPPITLTVDQVREVETLAALLSQDQIADYLGISRSTFHAICDRDPDVLERYKRGKARAIAHVANGLLQKARAGCKTSSIFYLKTQAGWRETAEMPDAAEPTEYARLSDEELRESAISARDRIGLPPSSGPLKMLVHGRPLVYWDDAFGRWRTVSQSAVRSNIVAGECQC